MRPKPIEIPPNDVTMSGSIWMGGKEQMERELARIRERERRANSFSIDKGGLLTLPFRQGAFYVGRILAAAKKAILNEHFLKLHIRGEYFSCKLEHRSAWALDEGAAMDKLVTIRSGDEKS